MAEQSRTPIIVDLSRIPEGHVMGGRNFSEETVLQFRTELAGKVIQRAIAAILVVEEFGLITFVDIRPRIVSSTYVFAALLYALRFMELLNEVVANIENTSYVAAVAQMLEHYTLQRLGESSYDLFVFYFTWSFRRVVT